MFRTKNERYCLAGVDRREKMIPTMFVVVDVEMRRLFGMTTKWRLVIIKRRLPKQKNRFTEARSLSEERCEDPSVVMIDSIIIDHGFVFAATRNTDEWTT